MRKKTVNEQRKSPRITLDTEVLCFKSLEETEISKGEIRFHADNISLGGVFLETTAPLKLDSVVYLRFKLPDAPRQITIKAKIIRINPVNSAGKPGMGLEFLRIAPEDKNMIDNFIKTELNESNYRK